MAATRASTGNSKPRVAAAVSTTPERKRNTTTTTKPATKTGTTKKSTTGAGVTKKRAPPAQHKRKPPVKDKVEGALEKAEGTATRKPGKKAADTKKMNGTDGKTARTRK
ncbi:hypothetical protein LTR70_007282 [Exophiala xenobiotica]|uniref:Uncharacterized protein n=1 Tax=Lithohypha guttulata TaxID=1690604 RepID=A0ABR0K2E4_9EURO|nr:hypothetical protein LTR24_007651 [Lithohypha guttulata]KAK5314141.1 hypothetical protein LTR70_007282 [Exophiala xenobiotica]